MKHLFSLFSLGFLLLLSGHVRAQTGLRVLHREATNNQLNTTAIKPYLVLDNTGSQAIPYSQITVRYWLTVENPAPVTNLSVYYAQLGTSNVRMTFVPLSPVRTGATGYVEYSFLAAAGSLAPLTKSGAIETGISKQNYSPFIQADDYSYALNRDFTLNTRITAYVNGQLAWGTEPTVPGTQPATPLTVTALATSTVFPTTDNSTLSALAAGGSGVYSYFFTGPGTINTIVNTAVVSALPAGVQTFTVTVTDTSLPTNQTATTTVSLTITGATPVNTPPVATTNASQTATVGTAFSYTVGAFTDAQTPNGLTYSALISPANNFIFNPATRVISGTPSLTGVSTVTVTATDPGSLSASTAFTITVVPPPVTLRVLHREAGNGQLTTNAIYPYFIVENTSNQAVPYSQVTVRYWLTVENPAPVTNLPVYSAGIGAGNVLPVFVPLNPVRTGATGYVEYRFAAPAGTLGAMGSSGAINTAISKQDYSPFNQTDDYSYVLNRDFTPNTRITAYVNGVLAWGTEPVASIRLAAEGAETPLQVRVLGNPARGSELSVEVRGATGQPLHFQVTDLTGRLVREHRVGQAGEVEQQTLSVGQPSGGLLLLRVSTPTQSQTLKVLKQ